MRLVLVDNFVMPDRLDPALFDVHPHMGLISLAAVAARDHHHVAIYDPKREIRFGRHAYDRDFYDRAAEDILQLAPDVVGFTTLGCSFLFAVNVADRIKRRAPGLPVVLGGPHATMLDRPILETYRQFDIVVRHEAEQTLLPLLANIESRAFDGIPGITWRGGRDAALRSTPGLPKIDDLDSLPIPNYDLYPIADLDLSLMRIEAGRGCPFVCTFCSTATFFQRDYRLKSADRIVAEMDLLHARHGASEFKLDHDLFTVNRRKVLGFCEAVEDRGYQWRVSARTDCVDAELLESMARAGCIGLYFGIETGSKRMQKIADKRLKLDGVDRMLDVAEGLGIETTASFITGYPEELAEDQDETLDMLGDCFRRPQQACTPQLHILLPEPGTPMFGRHAKQLAYDGYVTKFNARLFGAADRRQVRAHPELYSTYYYYPAAMPRARYTFAVDAVDALRAVGHEILSYAVRFYQGRLSRLLASFRLWLQSHRAAPITPDLVLEFVSESFGPAHHLTSLFRFELSIGALRNRTPLDPASAAHGARRGRGPSYRVNPASCLLSDLHDCTRLMELIRARPAAAGPLDPNQIGERGCYLTVLQAERSMHYRVDQGVGAILGLFERPRRLCEVIGLLRDIAGAPVHDGVLDELIDIGALIRASALPPARLGAAAVM